MELSASPIRIRDAENGVSCAALNSNAEISCCAQGNKGGGVASRTSAISQSLGGKCSLILATRGRRVCLLSYLDERRWSTITERPNALKERVERAELAAHWTPDAYTRYR